MNTCYLGLGSNIGNSFEIINDAIEALNVEGRVIKVSCFYTSPAWGYESSNDFLNCCVLFETNLEPLELLYKLHQIEDKLGRKRNKLNSHYTDRTIDIDILFYNDLIISTKSLSLPHPLLHKRSFVLEPLNDLDGDLIHPLLGLSIGYLKDNISDQDSISVYQA